MKRFALLAFLLLLASAQDVCYECGQEPCHECHSIVCNRVKYSCKEDDGTVGTKAVVVDPCQNFTCGELEYSCVYDFNVGFVFVPYSDCGMFCGESGETCRGGEFCPSCCPPGFLDCDGDEGCETEVGVENCGWCGNNCTECFEDASCVRGSGGDYYQCSGTAKAEGTFCSFGVCDGYGYCVDADYSEQECTGHGFQWDPDAVWEGECGYGECPTYYGVCCGDDDHGHESWAPSEFGSFDCCLDGSLLQDGHSEGRYLCEDGGLWACQEDVLEVGEKLAGTAEECDEKGFWFCSPSGDWTEEAGECSACEPGLTNCDGNCVNLTNNMDHCGQCDNPCDLAQTCHQGECVSFVCGDGECDTTETCEKDSCCSGVTVDLSSDPMNCGECGNVCGENMLCENAECVCEEGFEPCGTGCCDFSEACSIDADCPTGEKCCEGKCIVPECEENGDCGDGDPCTEDFCSAGCGMVCEHLEITDCLPQADGCCPSDDCVDDPDCLCKSDADCGVCEECIAGFCVKDDCGAPCKGGVCDGLGGCLAMPESCLKIEAGCREFSCSAIGVECVLKEECAKEEGAVEGRCVDDIDCDDRNSCTYDVCDPFRPDAGLDGCAHIIADCGSPCDDGVCTADGLCLPPGEEGEFCECDDFCGSGLSCVDGLCTSLAGCGDGLCGDGECSRCPQDCTLDECVLNDVCDWPIGENCVNSPVACACPAGKNCDVNDEHGEIRDRLFCYSTLTACGDGECREKECHTCPLDCEGPAEICLGDGFCDASIGETCHNSPDCSCDFELDIPESEQRLSRGSKKTVSFKIVNTGTSKQTYALVLSGSLNLAWDEATVELEPGEESLQQVEVSTERPGLHFLEIGIDQNGETTRTAIPFSIAEPTPVEQVMGLLDPVLSAKDVLEFVALLGAAIYSFFHLFVKKKKPPKYQPYTGPPPPAYDYGANYGAPRRP